MLVFPRTGAHTPRGAPTKHASGRFVSPCERWRNRKPEGCCCCGCCCCCRRCHSRTECLGGLGIRCRPRRFGSSFPRLEAWRCCVAATPPKLAAVTPEALGNRPGGRTSERNNGQGWTLCVCVGCFWVFFGIAPKQGLCRINYSPRQLALGRSE